MKVLRVHASRICCNDVPHEVQLVDTQYKGLANVKYQNKRRLIETEKKKTETVVRLCTLLSFMLVLVLIMKNHCH